MTTEQQPKPLKNSALGFRDFMITEVSFCLNQGYDKWEKAAAGWQGIPFEHEIVYEIAHEFNATNNILRVLLTIRAKAKDAPYNVSVQGMGFFTFDVAPEQKQIEQLARINCAAIIFPYIRETIADITRRSGLPTLHLQPINFVEMYKNLSSTSGEKEKKIGNE